MIIIYRLTPCPPTPWELLAEGVQIIVIQLLLAVCCLLLAACCLFFAVCCLLPFACCLLLAARRLLLACLLSKIRSKTASYIRKFTKLEAKSLDTFATFKIRSEIASYILKFWAPGCKKHNTFANLEFQGGVAWCVVWCGVVCVCEKRISYAMGVLTRSTAQGVGVFQSIRKVKN